MLGNIWNDLCTGTGWMMEHLVLINILLSFVIIFFQRRKPQTVWTWLLVLYFIPIVGFVLYLLIGQDFRKSRMFKMKEIEGEVNYAVRRQEKSIRRKQFRLSNPKMERFENLIYYNLEAASAVLTGNNDVQIYTDGREKFAALIREIRAAKTYIHLQYYIIRKDELWQAISRELIKKAKEGVEVRILFDSMGCRDMKKKDWEELNANGIQTAEFFPALLGKLHLRVNYRNHRKIAVIDGRVGFVGGFNIGKEYIGLSEKFGYWRDTHLCIEGSAVTSLAVRFVMDWNYAARDNLFLRDELFEIPEYVRNGREPVQIISSGPDSKSEEIRDNYMIPCKPDHPFVYWASYSYLGDMIEAGAKCYVYNNGFLHVKGLTVDGLVSCFGTANMDIRSFELNFEVNAVIYSEETTKKLEEAFEQDILNSTLVTKRLYEERSLLIRGKEQFSRLLSPLL